MKHLCILLQIDNGNPAYLKWIGDTVPNNSDNAEQSSKKEGEL